MKTLAIDTSTYALAIGIADGNKIIAEYTTNIQKNHSLRVMPAVQALMNDADVTSNELEKIIIGHGPGSYTGVRIGVTVAKTLAWTLNIPAASVSSLAALAASAFGFNGLVCPVFDARRGQVYTGLYRLEGNRLQAVKEDCNVLMSDWCQELNNLQESVLFVGQESAIHEETILTALNDRAQMAADTVPFIRPGALLKLGRDQEQTAESVVPNYARLAEAEAKWLAENKKKEKRSE